MNARRRDGLTALEVLVATVLAAILIAALLGVLRGLKASERALEMRSSGPAWQRNLAALLDNDLANARTYQTTAGELILTGYGGRAGDGTATWLRGGVVYAIRATKAGPWLVRSEIAGDASLAPATNNLTLAGVTEIRVGMTPPDAVASMAAASGQPALHDTVVLQPGDGREQPLADGLVIEFWGEESHAPLFRHRCRTP
ncbi:MAG: hypothetical protein KDA44_05265 [Planctomycetales bacterium]|nr:hypothetical protein [Planctomycetales bacterium]